ncbi:MAG TPA: AAA family ATPase [Gemmatimonadales bacterium]|jgi:DNA-binding SARP family transcriptional activator
MISCQTLGPPVVRLEDGTAPPPLQWRKNLALLVYLARSPKRTRSRDHLLGLLWGDQPEEKARGSLNQALLTLRSFAGDGVESDRAHVRLSDRVVTLDVDQLETLAARGDYEAAARLILGVFLDGVNIIGASGFDDWTSAERAYWLRRSVDVLVGLSTRALAGGTLDVAEDAAARALELDPYAAVAERVWLRAVALRDDRGRALAGFAAFVERLKSESGAEPDAETAALARRVGEGREWRMAEATPGHAPLVGRKAELERLLAIWERCGAGRMGVALIEADGGLGKSRIVEEVAGRVRLDGGVVVAVRAVEADAHESWSGVLGIARVLLDARGVAAASPAALAQLRGGASLTSPARALAEVLSAVADEQPVLVIVDDAQWLDRESLLALGTIARDLTDAPVFLLITASPQVRRTELDEVRSHIGRELDGTALVLKPLTADHLRELARWAAPAYDDLQLERLARRIAADSAGIPLLAVELLNAVATGLDLQRIGGAWPEPLKTLEQTLPGDLPDAITAAVRVNFHRLSKDAHRVLKAAAVLDGRVAPAVIERASGVSGDALAAALDELEWQRWLAADARGYSFVARIVRDVVVHDMVLPGERARILELAGR